MRWLASFSQTMKAKKAESIRSIFDMSEEEFPDKSTEFLMEITCQRAALVRLNIDHGDVAEALQQTTATRDLG